MGAYPKIKKYTGDRIPVELGRFVVSAVYHDAMTTKFTVELGNNCKLYGTLNIATGITPGDLIPLFTLLPVDRNE